MAELVEAIDRGTTSLATSTCTASPRWLCVGYVRLRCPGLDATATAEFENLGLDLADIARSCQGAEPAIPTDTRFERKGRNLGTRTRLLPPKFLSRLPLPTVLVADSDH